MKTVVMAALIFGAAIGAGATYAIVNRQQNHKSDTNTSVLLGKMEGMDHGNTMADMSMNAMKAELAGLSGDAFDKAFLQMMIEHHQGAIDMARQAQQSAKHDEIKAMANNIISAQTREIEQMKEWQRQWGY